MPDNSKAAAAAANALVETAKSQFHIITNSSTCGARTGCIHFTPNSTNTTTNSGNISSSYKNAISTPTGFISSHRGTIPHLTPDILISHLIPNDALPAATLPLEHFLELHTNSSSSSSSFSSSTFPPLFQSNKISFRNQLCIPSTVPIFSSIRETHAPLSTYSKSNSDTSIMSYSSQGFQSVNVSHFLALNGFSSKSDKSNKSDDSSLIVPSMGADFMFAPADVTESIVTGSKIGKNRINKISKRTESWLDAIFSSEPNTNTSSIPSVIVSAIPGLPESAQRSYLAKIKNHISSPSSSKIHIGGLAFYTLRDNTTPDSSIDIHSIAIAAGCADLPLIYLGHDLISPHHTLDLFSIGIDIVSTDFISSAVDAGIAYNLNFPLTVSEKSKSLKDTTETPTYYSLWSKISPDGEKTETDLRPLSENCNCYTCKTSHRAYIHHLLNANEMLAWVLLAIHNYNNWSNFTREIKKSITNNTFQECFKEFTTLYGTPLEASQRITMLSENKTLPKNRS